MPSENFVNKGTQVVAFFAITFLSLGAHAQLGGCFSYDSSTDTWQTAGGGTIMDSKPDASQLCSNSSAGASSGATTSSGTYAGAPSDAVDAINSCNSAETTAEGACKSSGFMGMSSSDMMMAEMALGSVTSAVAQTTSGKTAQELCLLSKGMQASMATLSLLKANSCSSAQNACIQKCQSADKIAEQDMPDVNGTDAVTKVRNALTKIERKASSQISSCQSNNASQSAMMAMMMMSMNASSLASSCASALTAATPIPTPTTAIDCTNSAVASTNIVCICQSNPSNAMCSTSSLAGSTGNTPGASTTGAGQPFSAVSTNNGDGMPAAAVPGSTPQNSGLANDGAGGGAGGGFGAGGGAGGLAGSGDGQAQGSGIDPHTITGASNSGGGGGGLSANPNTAGAGRGGAGSGGGAGGSGYNLNGLLPSKKDFQNRGLAGMATTGVDGITGAMGPSIWEKVSNRYQVKSPTLIQEK